MSDQFVVSLIILAALLGALLIVFIVLYLLWGRQASRHDKDRQ